MNSSHERSGQDAPLTSQAQQLLKDAVSSIDRYYFDRRFACRLARCCEAILRRFGDSVESICVAGSLVLGTADQFSDIDLAIILNRSVDAVETWYESGTLVEAFINDVLSAQRRIQIWDNRRNPAALYLMAIPLVDTASRSATLRRLAFEQLFSERPRNNGEVAELTIALEESARTLTHSQRRDRVGHPLLLFRFLNLAATLCYYNNNMWIPKFAHMLREISMPFPKMKQMLEQSLNALDTSEANIMLIKDLALKSRRAFIPRVIDLELLLATPKAFRIIRNRDLTDKMKTTLAEFRTEPDVAKFLALG